MAQRSKQSRPLLVKAAAYARLIGVDPRSTVQLINQRGLPAQKVNGVWHLLPAEADT